MKFLKWFIGLIAILLLIYTLLCLVGPKSMNMDMSSKMRSGAPQVYNLINNLENWEQWSAWHLGDSTIVINYPGKREGVGGSYTWSGDMSGAGSLEIVENEKNKSMKTKIMFKDHEGHSSGQWTLTPDGKKVDVNWTTTSDQKIPFMMRGMMLLTGRKSIIKKQYAKSLENIKELAETRSKGVYSGYKINNVTIPEKNYVTKRASVGMENIQSFYTRNLPSIVAKVTLAGTDMDGMPCGLFYKWDAINNKTDMAAAIPVKEATSIKGFSSLTIPGKKAVQIDYYGDYKGTAKAHEAMAAYLKDHGLFNDTPVIEEYVTDPSTEENPSKWLTKITYYIANEE